MSETPPRRANDARAAYNVAQWSSGYFDVTASGRVVAQPDGRRDGPAVDLSEVAAEIREAGLQLPVLVRFVDVLRDRVRNLKGAFAAAMEASGYRGRYTPVYPIKVNQQHRVVAEVLHGGGVGLECGSKPELMAVLAVAGDGSRVICNGYKDHEYVRLALRARQLGLDCWIVVEKLSELDIVLAESERLGVAPRLGLRVRLASIGEGKWRNTGGEKSKFGLAAAQALTVVERLKDAERLDSLGLLHFHLGSQLTGIADIQRGLREAARYYAELRRLGADITCVDVGGGLGVDYQGTRSRHNSSMNYSVAEYAENVIRAINEACTTEGLPHPDIITEAGRAMTAHHAVLITEVVDRDAPPEMGNTQPPGEEAPAVLRELWAGYSAAGDSAELALYHGACDSLGEAQGLYTHGLLSLGQRAEAERLYYGICRRLQARLDPSVRAHREVLEELKEKLADKLFVNLSIFQSMPDVWAIGQIFPILPLTGLDEPLTRRGVLQDLTCDSDGSVHAYVDRDGVDATLALPPHRPDERLRLGVFLVGAYQEILGDMHNLFGDTDAVNVELTADGWRLSQPVRGDNIETALSVVHFEAAELRAGFRRRVEAADLQASAREACLEAFEAGLAASTYLRVDEC